MAESTDIKIPGHILVPKHIKLEEGRAEAILKKYNISKKQLPKIRKTDPAVLHLDVVPGDIIEIIRESPTIGKANFYRLVV